MLIRKTSAKIVVGNKEIETTDLAFEMTLDLFDETKYRDALREQGMLRRRRELHGEWLTREEPALPERLAAQYHTECDVYDRQVCTGERNGEPIPVTPQEQGSINRNAYQVRRRLLAENPGVTQMQLHEAIAKESR